jgi:hypothetical protein
VPTGERFEFMKSGGLGHEVLEPLDAFRAFAMQHAALGPPQDVLRMLVSFAVADVAAAERAQPESLRHLPRSRWCGSSFCRIEKKRSQSAICLLRMPLTSRATTNSYSTAI